MDPLNMPFSSKLNSLWPRSDPNAMRSRQRLSSDTTSNRSIKPVIGSFTVCSQILQDLGVEVRVSITRSPEVRARTTTPEVEQSTRRAANGTMRARNAYACILI
jgi:hypothetical protein